MKTFEDITTVSNIIFADDPNFKGVIRYCCIIRLVQYLEKPHSYFLIYFTDGEVIALAKRHDKIVLFKPYCSNVCYLMEKFIRILLIEANYNVENMDSDVMPPLNPGDLEFGAAACMQFLWLAKAHNLRQSSYVDIHRLIFPPKYRYKEHDKLCDFIKTAIEISSPNQLLCDFDKISLM